MMQSAAATAILAQMTWSQTLLGLALAFVCFLLIVVILLQRGRGGGLAGALGGAGGSAAFGAKTGDVFTWITVVVAAIFLLLAVVGNFALDESPGKKSQVVETGEPEGAGEATVPIGAVDADAVPAPDGTSETPPVGGFKIEPIEIQPKKPEAGSPDSGARGGGAAPGGAETAGDTSGPNAGEKSDDAQGGEGSEKGRGTPGA